MDNAFLLFIKQAINHTNDAKPRIEKKDFQNSGPNPMKLSNFAVQKVMMIDRSIPNGVSHPPLWEMQVR